MLTKAAMSDAVDDAIKDDGDTDQIIDALLDHLIENMESVHGREELRQLRDRADD